MIKANKLFSFLSITVLHMIKVTTRVEVLRLKSLRALTFEVSLVNTAYISPFQFPINRQLLKKSFFLIVIDNSLSASAAIKPHSNNKIAIFYLVKQHHKSNIRLFQPLGSIVWFSCLNRIHKRLACMEYSSKRRL